MTHEIQIILVSLLKSLNLLKILHLILTEFLLLLWIACLLHFDVYFFNGLGYIFDVNNILQELVVTHGKLNIDDLTGASLLRVAQLLDLIGLLSDYLLEMLP